MSKTTIFIWAGLAFAAIILGLIAGAANSRYAEYAASPDAYYADGGAEEGFAAEGSGPASRSSFDTASRGNSDSRPPSEPSSGGSAAQDPMPRQIIRDANLGLTVEEYEPTKAAVDRIVEGAEGFYGNVNVSRRDGETSRANLEIRVPAAVLDRAVADLRRLGEVEYERIDSRDITASFYDAEARLRTKQTLLRRLEILLESSSGSAFSDQLAIHGQIDKVTTEIEQLQSRLRRWESEVTFSTIRLELTIVAPFDPGPVTVEDPDPGLGTRVDAAFGGSVESIENVGEDLLVVLAGNVLWLVPLLGVILIGWRKIARARRPDAAVPTE